MKKYILPTLLFLVLMLLSYAYLAPDYVEKALIVGADTKAVFHVVDDAGKPVEGAKIGAAFVLNNDDYESELTGYTDKNGIVEFRDKSVGEVVYSIRKPNFYTTIGKVDFRNPSNWEECVKDGKWQPYGKTYSVILKPIKNQVPMRYYSSFNKIPEVNVPLGYDLEVGDFTAPYGKGKIADFFLTYQEERKEDFWLYHGTFRFSFPNAYDGFYRQKKDSFSEFASSYHANTNAVYRKELVLEHNFLDLKNKIDNSLTEEEYLVLRIRTKVNHKGEMVEAYYSKIYGPIHITGKTIALQVYMNLKPNSTNLEFDKAFYLRERRSPPKKQSE